MSRRPIASRIADSMETGSWIREMFEQGIRLKQQFGDDNVFDFSLGNPNAAPPEAWFDAVRAVVAERDASKHRYMPTAGFPETRAAVAAHVAQEYGYDVDAGSVIMTTGAAGGMNVALRAICDPGDEIIVLAPFFPEYKSYIEQAGAKMVLAETDDAFQPVAAVVAAAITEQTRGIIVNSPANPTGVVFSERNCKPLAAALARRDCDAQPIYLLLDDPYRRIIYELDKCPSVADHYRRVILVSSYSKDLSIPGERAGYIAIPAKTRSRDVLLAAMTMLNRTLGFVNMPAFTQRVVARCAAARCDLRMYRDNRDLLCDALRDYGYKLIRPDGSMFVFPQTPIADDVRFVDMLLEQRVLVVPGRGFGRPGHIRISFAVEPRVIDGALPGFKKAIERCR